MCFVSALKKKKNDIKVKAVILLRRMQNSFKDFMSINFNARITNKNTHFMYNALQVGCIKHRQENTTYIKQMNNC